MQPRYRLSHLWTMTPRQSHSSQLPSHGPRIVRQPAPYHLQRPLPITSLYLLIYRLTFHKGSFRLFAENWDLARVWYFLVRFCKSLTSCSIRSSIIQRCWAKQICLRGRYTALVHLLTPLLHMPALLYLETNGSSKECVHTFLR
jgi:hypothetical protein